MIFKGCAGCLFGNLCRTERGVCAHYCQLMNDDEEEKIDRLIECRRVTFREEWFQYLEENTYNC